MPKIGFFPIHVLVEMLGLDILTGKRERERERKKREREKEEKRKKKSLGEIKKVRREKEMNQKYKEHEFKLVSQGNLTNLSISLTFFGLRRV